MSPWRRLWPPFLALLLLLQAAAGSPSAGAVAVRRHVILIDGSGSMDENGDHLYEKGKVQGLFHDLLASDAFAPADEVLVAIFSLKDERHDSPNWIVGTAHTVADLRAHEPTLRALGGDTALSVALQEGQAKLKSHAGTRLLWLLTDNIQEQDGVESTAKFYASLAEATDLFRIYLFPVDVQAPHGLVLYAMAQARGERDRQGDAAALDQAIEAVKRSALKERIGDGGFLARPLNEQTLDVQITSFTPAAGSAPISFTRDAASGLIRLRGFAEGEPIRGQFHIVLTSRFASLRIKQAAIAAQLVHLSSGDFDLTDKIPQRITPTRVTLEPGQRAEYTVELQIDPPHLTWNPFNDPAAPFADEGTIRGELEIMVSAVQFEAVQPAKYFGVQQIPEILGNAEPVRIPVPTNVLLYVELPWWRLLLLMGLLLAVLLILWLLYRVTLGRRWRLRLYTAHGEQQALLRPGQRLPVEGFGQVTAGVFGLSFVPERGRKGERRVKLTGKRGEVRLADLRSFTYEIGGNPKRMTGGEKRGRTGEMY